MAGETKLGIAQIPIRATLDELDKDLAGVRRHVESALAGVQNLGKIALGGLAAGALAMGGAIATIGPAAVEAASNLSESMNKANVVFGDSLKVIDDFAKTSAESFGISKQAAYEATGTFGNLFTAIGLNKPAAADMSISIVELAADLASFNNIPTDQALEKLRSGLVGEAEPLRSLGVNLTEAQVQAKALVMGLAKTAGELTPAMKVQARYALILEQTTTAQGDFARTSDGLANTQRILGATFKDISADIGTALLPGVLGIIKSVAPLVKTLMPKLQSVLTALAPVVEEIGNSIGFFVNAIASGEDPINALFAALAGFPDLQSWFGGIVMAIEGFVATIQPTIDQVTAWIGQNVELQDVLIALGVAIAAFVIPAIISMVAAAAPIIVAFLAIVAVAALLRQAWTENWGGIRDTLTEFWEGTAKPALTALWNWLSVNVPAAIKTLATFWNETLLPALREVLGFLDEFVIPGFKAVANVVSAVVGKAVEALAGLWENLLLPALRELWKFIDGPLGSVLKWLGENILPKIKELFGAIGDAIKILQGGLNTLADSIRGLKLPDWLMPGSPTPFEKGLLGISDAAMQARKTLDGMLGAWPGGMSMSARLEAMPEMAGLGNGGSADTYNQQQTSVNISVNDPLTGALVMRMFQQQERGRLNARMG